MEARYSIDTARNRVEEVLVGDVTLDELRAFTAGVLADPRLEPHFTGLIDISRATIHLTVNEVDEFARLLMEDPRAAHGRTAFIVRGEFSHGMVRMFESLSRDTLPVAIFEDRAGAEAWLDASPMVQEEPRAEI